MEDASGSNQKERERAPRSASPSPEAPPAKRDRRQLSLVLVEDNPTDVFLVREALEHHRIDAVLICHRDGEEMFRYMDQIDAGMTARPDAVLLDLNLPRYSGQAVLARIRRSPVCGDVPVVVVTSSMADEDRVAALSLGATEYFHKSIDYDESMRLGEVVLAVTGRSDAE